VPGVNAGKRFFSYAGNPEKNVLARLYVHRLGTGNDGDVLAHRIISHHRDWTKFHREVVADMGFG